MEKNFFSLSAALLSDPFCSKEITDISIINEYFVASTLIFTLHLDSLPSNSIKFLSLYLSRFSAVITVTLLLLRQGEIDGLWYGFLET